MTLTLAHPSPARADLLINLDAAQRVLKAEEHTHALFEQQYDRRLMAGHPIPPGLLRNMADSAGEIRRLMALVEDLKAELENDVETYCG